MHEEINAEVTSIPHGNALGANRGEHPLGEEEWSTREANRLIVYCYAGHAAEIQLDPSKEAAANAKGHAADDDEQADHYLRFLNPKKRDRAQRERRLRLEARGLVIDHWDAIRALAGQLLERKTLGPDEAAWIVAIAEGEHAKRALDEYRRRRAFAMAGSPASDSRRPLTPGSVRMAVPRVGDRPP